MCSALRLVLSSREHLNTDDCLESTSCSVLYFMHSSESLQVNWDGPVSSDLGFRVGVSLCDS